MRRSAVAFVLFVLSALAFSLPASAVEDTTPPTLVSLTVSPTSVDVSASSQDVTVTAVITDDLSGVSYVNDPTPSDVPSFVFLYSPSGNQSTQGDTNFRLSSGNTYTATMTIPQYGEQGVWRDWDVYLQDEAGNFTRVSEAQMLASGINAAVGVGTVNLSYPRTISLSLTRHRASGNVRSDTPSTCYWFVPVSVQRKTDSGWKKVRSTLADYQGHFSVKIRKTGRYRAVADSFGLGTPPITTCQTATAKKRLT
jgi:hypothetical protein